MIKPAMILFHLYDFTIGKSFPDIPLPILSIPILGPKFQLLHLLQNQPESANRIKLPRQLASCSSLLASKPELLVVFTDSL